MSDYDSVIFSNKQFFLI